MTKKLLIVSFVLAIFMFASCDTGISYPKATVAEFEEAYTVSSSVITTKTYEAHNGIWGQLNKDGSPTFYTETIELDNESLTSYLYSSVSGEITWNVDNTNYAYDFDLILDLTLSGSGPVVTFYAQASLDGGYCIFSNIQVNGHDMTDDLKDILSDSLSDL